MLSLLLCDTMACQLVGLRAKRRAVSETEHPALIHSDHHGHKTLSGRPAEHSDNESLHRVLLPGGAACRRAPNGTVETGRVREDMEWI